MATTQISQNTLTINQIQSGFFSIISLLDGVLRDRSLLMQNQISDLASAITTLNGNIKEVSDLIAGIKRGKGLGGNSGLSAVWSAVGGADKFNAIKIKYSLDLGYLNYDEDSALWDADAQRVQGVLDQLTNQSSQMTNRLQGLNNKYNEANDARNSVRTDQNQNKIDLISLMFK